MARREGAAFRFLRDFFAGSDGRHGSMTIVVLNRNDDATIPYSRFPAITDE